MTSFLPLAATREPRTAMLQRSLILSHRTSAMPSLKARTVSSCTSPSNQSGVRGRFCGWKIRPASRPVRAAPQNCTVPRRRPSDDAASRRAVYLAGLVAEAC